MPRQEGGFMSYLCSTRRGSRYKRILLILINGTVLLVTLSLLHEIFHLRSPESVQQHVKNIAIPIDLSAYKAILEEAYQKCLYKLIHIILVTLMVNFVVCVDAISRLWRVVEKHTSSPGLQSAVFHSVWSVALVVSYNFMGLKLYSTWLMTITDTGLNDLTGDGSGSKTSKTVAILLFLTSALMWFISGYLAGSLHSQWRNLVFPLVTMFMMLQIVYDLRMEPDIVKQESTHLPPHSHLKTHLQTIADEEDFPIDNIRFRVGRLGAGQTFGITENLVVLSAPSLDDTSLTPEEWTALTAIQMGHWRQRTTLIRVTLSFLSRLLWGPIAMRMMADPLLFLSFNMSSENIVVAFAITEMFASYFDDVVYFGKRMIFRFMGRRAVKYAVRLVGRDAVKSATVKVALANRIPLYSTSIFAQPATPVSEIISVLIDF